MKNRYAPKRANPKTMITHFREIFKPIGLKKTEFPKSFVSRHSRVHSENLSYQRNRYAFTDSSENREVETETSATFP